TTAAGSGITPTGTSASYTTPYSSFQGYTQGPTFWGKSFYMWPPDPRTPLQNNTTDKSKIQMYLGDLGIITTTTNSSGNNYTWAGSTSHVSNAQGIYNSTNGFWTNDGGATLSTYLNNKVVATNGKNGTTAASLSTAPTNAASGQITLTTNAG